MRFVRKLQRAYQELSRWSGTLDQEPAYLLSSQVDAYLTAQMIGRALINKTPFLASRLGWTEATCLGIYRQKGEISDEALRERIWRYSGVFPATEKQFSSFVEAFLGAIPSIDLLGLLRSKFERELIEEYGNNPVCTELGSLEPFLHPVPWSQWLEDRKVLVVHPFTESIARQYQLGGNRIFVNSRVLPRFDLKLVKAPQTIAGNAGEFSDWDSALTHLKRETEKTDFDVAIIGCGAYGLPLGAFIKQLGRICIHIGGATQLLFGITGARWREQPAFRALETDAWCLPLESERPPNWKKVEDGCYW